MTEIDFGEIKYRWRIKTWGARQAWKRARIGLRYAIGRATPDDAQDLIYDCQKIAGRYSLISFGVEGTLDAALARWQDSPALISLVEAACARVWSKWDGGDGETEGAAQDWALDLVAEYAKQDGIELVEIDE